MPNALLAILAVALVSAVGAGVAIHAMDASPQSLLTIEGNVTAVDVSTHWDAPVHIEVRAANGTMYDVSLAPPWWWAEHKYPAIHVNDTVKVTGVRDDANETETNDTGEGIGITAWTISINGGATIALRTGDMPAWAQERSGQTGVPPAQSHNETESQNETPS